MLDTMTTQDGITYRDKSGVLVAVVKYSHDRLKKNWLVTFHNQYAESGLNCHRFNNLKAAEYLVLCEYEEKNNS